VRAATASARRASASSPCVRATIACWWRTDPTHDAEGLTITSWLEHLDVVADKRERVTLVAGVDVHLPAAGLRLGEHDLVAEPLEQGPSRAHVGVERVREAGDEQGDAHA
jgi:hypothetical protein